MRKQSVTIKLCWMAILFMITVSGGGCMQNEQEQESDSDELVMPDTSLTTSAFEKAGYGQVLYVPVYPHIYTQNEERTFNLTSTLSIRNTSQRETITVTRVDFFDSDGKPVHQYLPKPVTLGSLSSTYYVVEEGISTEGVGASFLVEWISEQDVSEPVIEAIMVSTASQQGISFIRQGKVIRSKE